MSTRASRIDSVADESLSALLMMGASETFAAGSKPVAKLWVAVRGVKNLKKIIASKTSTHVKETDILLHAFTS